MDLELDQVKQYRLRYFFDPGSGVCLWSDNDMAREKFGYPVELGDPRVTSTVKTRAEDLIARFDTSIEWTNPSGPSLWSDMEHERFQVEAAGFLRSLQECLGAEFEIRDCIR